MLSNCKFINVILKSLKELDKIKYLKEPAITEIIKSLVLLAEINNSIKRTKFNTKSIKIKPAR